MSTVILKDRIYYDEAKFEEHIIAINLKTRVMLYAIVNGENGSSERGISSCDNYTVLSKEKIEYVMNNLPALFPSFSTEAVSIEQQELEGINLQ